MIRKFLSQIIVCGQKKRCLIVWQRCDVIVRYSCRVKDCYFRAIKYKSKQSLEMGPM